MGKPIIIYSLSKQDSTVSISSRGVDVLKSNNVDRS